MPCLRGIEVSLTTNPQDEQIPEFPHPEGSSARLLGIYDPRKTSPSSSINASSSSSSGLDSGLTRSQKSNPTISVYVPSVPGYPFAIKYTVNSVPPLPSRYIFFRLYINSRPIASWGTDPSIRPEGMVVKSLWAPGSQYVDQVGFEGRNLVFLPGHKSQSIAEDGGLIEVQAFRAKDRRSRVPRLEKFRYQENYGIAAPSIGLLDQPQEACFYDWHLVDPRDSPFATFRFHYRSWDNLYQLSLIPPTDVGLLRSTSFGYLSRASEGGNDYRVPRHESGKKPSSHASSSDEAVFQGGYVPHDMLTRDRSNTASKNYFLKSPPELFSTSLADSGVPQPSKELRDAYRVSYLQRPLPELPSEEPSSLLRRASVVSATPSLTPSLAQYVDGGSFDQDKIELGVAQLLPLSQSESSLVVLEGVKPRQSVDSSISDYETSPASTNDSFPQKILSPKNYLPTTGSSFELDLNNFGSQGWFRSLNQQKPWPTLTPSYFSEQDLSRVGAIKLSESEWMSRTPSPVRNEEPNSLCRMWSPRPERPAGKSLFSGLRRRKLSDSPRKPAPKGFKREEVFKPSTSSSPAREDIGNWI
ncbi:hypothetical protein B0T19DRAFT_171985 [Cercophora scortea]|uniref:Uncharacterized protein n=1 Tax=Cercophora scortea TaxID=314031 RepID=A0AAE0MCQ2_9PEZI|nr:hypothetical protein B0T19DRAFT_171985 [Cercophora scortea]